MGRIAVLQTVRHILAAINSAAIQFQSAALCGSTPTASHLLDVHNRKSPRQNGARLFHYRQRVISLCRDTAVFNDKI
jgi:hypothetical protein